jgi:hypothetical protein
MENVKMTPPVKIEELIDVAKIEGFIELSKYKSPMCFPDKAPQIFTDAVIKQFSPRQISS